MKIILRVDGHAVTEVNVEPGKTYRVGRGPDNDIQLMQPSISRKQGELYFAEGEWHFKDLSAEEGPRDHILRGGSPIHLPEHRLEILFGSDVEQERTQLIRIPHPDGGTPSSPDATASLQPPDKRGGRTFARKMMLSAATLLIIGGITLVVVSRKYPHFAQSLFNRRMDIKTLDAFTKERVVRFELHVDPKDRDQLMKDAHLKNSDLKDDVGFCTGFHMGGGIVVTASHCLFGEDGFSLTWPITLKSNDNKVHEVKKVLAMNYALDYLVLDVPSLKGYPAFKWADHPEVGQKCFTVGNVAGEGIAIRDGILSSETPDENDPSVKYLRFSAPASPGNSGGPLVTDRGTVLGLVSAKSMAENYNIGIPSQYIRKDVEAIRQGHAPNEMVYDFNHQPSFESGNGNPFQALLGGGKSRVARVASELALPVIPKEWFDKYSLSRKIDSLRISVSLPQTPKNLNLELYQAFRKKYLTAYAGLEKKLRANHVAVPGWDHMVSEKNPVVVPTDTSYAESLFKTSSGKAAFSGAYLMEAPSYEDMRLAEILKTKQITKSSALAPDGAGLFELTKRIAPGAGNDYQLTSTAEDTEEKVHPFGLLGATRAAFTLAFPKGIPDDDHLKTAMTEAARSVLFGKNGAEFSLKIFPYVRPNSQKDFTLTDFVQPIHWQTQTDQRSRRWWLGDSNFYGLLNYRVLCLPEGILAHCRAVFGQPAVSSGVDQFLLSNDFRYSVSERIPVVDSFTPQELLSSTTGPAITEAPNRKDFKFESDPRTHHLRVRLGALGKVLDLGKVATIEAVQPVSGLVLEKKDSTRWVALGARVIRHVLKTGKLQVCTFGFDFKGYAYDELVDPSIGGSGLSRMLASDQASSPDDEKVLAHPTSRTFGELKLPLRKFGVCAPMHEADEPNRYQVFKKLRKDVL